MLPKDFQFNLGQEVYVLRYRQDAFARRIKETCEYCLGTGKLIAKNNIEVQCSECWGRGYNTKKIDDKELYDIIAVKYKIVRLDFFINQKVMCCKMEFELSDDKYKKEYKIQEHTRDYYFDFYCYFDEKGNSETVTNDLSYYVRPACVNYKPINLFLTLQEAEKGILLYTQSIIHALEKSEQEEQKEKQIKVEIKQEKEIKSVKE